MIHDGLSVDEHQERHLMLLAGLDELIAEYLLHHPQAQIAKLRIMDLLEWAYHQSYVPTVIEGGRITLHRPGFRPSIASYLGWRQIAAVLKAPEQHGSDIRPEPGLAQRIEEICALHISAGTDLEKTGITIFLTEQQEAACSYAAQGPPPT